MKNSDKRILILVSDNFQDMEAMYPLYRFREAGMDVVVAGAEAKEYKGKHGYPLNADIAIEGCRSQDFDAVIIPGGWAPDAMRQNKYMLDIVREMHEANKVVAAICHGAWVPISAGITKGHTMTAYIAVKDDVINSGASFVDEEVVVDGNLITSRKPDDLPAFCSAILDALG